MFSTKVCEGVYSVGILNPGLRVFDIVMETKFGTTYNSYVVSGSEKTALIETCHESFFDQYIANIESVCSLQNIDYIVLNHNEPDHSGALSRLMALCPKATIIVSRAGSVYLKNITNREDLPVQVVNDGDTVDLGDKTLKFLNAPFLHWPDSMFTWLPEDKVLFSCDFFGSHYCEPYIFDYNIAYPGHYFEALEYYFAAIFGPFKPYVQKGLAKVADLDIAFVCNSHGPILTANGLLNDVKEKYDLWSKPSIEPNRLVPVFYCSAYGNTYKLAEGIASGIRAELPDAEVCCYDLIEYDMTYLQGLLNSSVAFAIGSPTLNADALPPVWQLLSHVDAINCRKKPALVFGSYGWSGEAVPNIIARLQGIKMNVFGQGMKVTFIPSESDLQAAEDLGHEFAKTIFA